MRRVAQIGTAATHHHGKKHLLAGLGYANPMRLRCRLQGWISYLTASNNVFVLLLLVHTVEQLRLSEAVNSAKLLGRFTNTIRLRQLLQDMSPFQCNHQ